SVSLDFSKSGAGSVVLEPNPSSQASERVYTYQEVAEHNKKKDLYLIINGNVYDATSFVDEHPGGEEVLLAMAGEDATQDFEDVGHSDEARDILKGFYLGTLRPDSLSRRLWSTVRTSTRKYLGV